MPDKNLDMTQRSIGAVEQHKLSDEEWDKISAFFDPDANITRDQIYPFRFIAASDGLDAYYTRQDVDTSLEPMAADLRAGQSFMGNHDIGTFAYGNSFDGRVVDADALSRSYEPTFYRKYDRPELRSSKWLIGDYYVRRGLHLNGQPVDDLIAAMQAGILRKASISFTVGEYMCGIDGKQQADMASLMFGEGTDDEECRHFPGLEYKGDLAYSTMKHNSLLETSGVYKNASPSSLLVQRAVTMAEQGMIPSSEIVRLEERFQQRLPRPAPTVFPVGTARREEADMPRAQAPTEKRETDPAQIQDSPDEGASEEPSTTPETPQEPAAEPATEPAQPEGGSGGEDTVSEFVQAVDRLIDNLPEDTAELDSATDAARRVDEALIEAGREDTASAGAARQYEMREQAMTEALGEKLSVESIRSLKALAEIGDELYRQRVTVAKQERVRALGEHANADAYEAQLLAQRDVAYVEQEIVAYGAVKREALAGTRQTRPPAPTETKPSRSKADAGREPSDPQEEPNLLARRHKERE